MSDLATQVAAAPWLMKALSVVGTAARFLVGGGILAHGIPAVHHWTEGLAGGGGLAGSLGPALVNAAVGVAAALINTNLTGGPLVHCMGITDSVMCIFGEERLDAIARLPGPWLWAAVVAFGVALAAGPWPSLSLVAVAGLGLLLGLGANFRRQ